MSGQSAYWPENQMKSYKQCKKKTAIWPREEQTRNTKQAKQQQYQQQNNIKTVTAAKSSIL